MAPTTFPVTVHEFLPTPTSRKPTHVYEYGMQDDTLVQSNSTSVASTHGANGHGDVNHHALVFIGGLGDGPHTVPYIQDIVGALFFAHSVSPSSSQTSQPKQSVSLEKPWTVFEVRLSSAFSGWGNSSLSQDVNEIAAVVRYLRSTLNKHLVVLMGHSTGCQDCVAYLHRWTSFESGNRDPTQPVVVVDAVILQAPVSDREAIAMTMAPEEMQMSIDVARIMIDEGKEKEYMPKDKLPADMRDTPVTAYRFHSLTSRLGDDDFFSSDFTDSETRDIWSSLTKPVLVVPSEKDEFVPDTVNVQGLMDKWRGSCRPGVYSDLSGLIPEANHCVDNDEGKRWLVGRVLRFLAQLEQDDK